MKNVTVCVPDDVYRNARIRAAERGTSVSALVSEYLRSLAGRESEFYVQATRGSRSDPLSHEQATGLVESFLGESGSRTRSAAASGTRGRSGRGG